LLPDHAGYQPEENHEAIKPEFESLNDICADLTPYGTQPRYPAELRLEEEDADKALAKAHHAKDFMEKTLPEIFCS
jgi:hypothetical protein